MVNHQTGGASSQSEKRTVDVALREKKILRKNNSSLGRKDLEARLEKLLGSIKDVLLPRGGGLTTKEGKKGSRVILARQENPPRRKKKQQMKMWCRKKWGVEKSK